MDFFFRYWLLKRKSGGNKPLLTPRPEAAELLLSSSADADRERKMKRFVSLRQDLERVRNLCYMVSRREKLQRSFVKLREQILAKQLHLLGDKSCAQQMSLLEMSAILEANHGPNIYDRLFSHGDAEVHTENDFEVIVSRISGEIAENSAQIRKDNPYRKGLVSGGDASSFGGAGHQDNQNSVSYERIFSDMSASETDDILNLSASMVKKDKNSKSSVHGRGASTASSSRRGGKRGSAQGKRPIGRPRKNSSTTKKPVTRSDTSDDASATDDDLLQRGKKSGAAVKTKLNKNKSSIFSDTESEDSKSRPRSPVFRTKAAMKDFSVEELSRGRKGNEKKSVGKTKGGSKAKLVNSSTARPSARKAALSGSSDNESSSESEGDEVLGGRKVAASSISPVTTATQLQDKDSSEFYPMIVPERAAARKAAAKLKVSHNDRAMPQPEVYDFDAFDTVANNIPKEVLSAIKEPELDLVAGSSKYKRLFDSDSDSLAEREEEEDASAKKRRKKKEKDAFPFVPERKAAKKASAHLKESGGGTRKEDGGGGSPKKSSGRPRKKEFLPPLSERILGSDSDSDQEPFPMSSPRGKSSRGRGTSAKKSPRRKPAASARAFAQVKAAAAAAAVQGHKPPPKPKALSSRAEAFLSQRESQLDDIFEECGLGTKKSKKEPDKKLKTSEGLPEFGLSSPTPDPPATGHSGASDSSSSGSSSSSSSSSEDEGSTSVAATKTPKSTPAEPSSAGTTVPESSPSRQRPGDSDVASRRGDLHSPTVPPSGPSSPLSPAAAASTITTTNTTNTITTNTTPKGSLASPLAQLPGESREPQKVRSIFSPARSPKASPSDRPPTPGRDVSQAMSKGGDGKHLGESDKEEKEAAVGERQQEGLQAQRSPLKEQPPPQQQPQPTPPTPPTPQPQQQQQQVHVDASRNNSSTNERVQDTENFVENLHKGTSVKEGEKTKQTDDSGFDSDEKAQQNQQNFTEEQKKQHQVQQHEQELVERSTSKQQQQQQHNHHLNEQQKQQQLLQRQQPDKGHQHQWSQQLQHQHPSGGAFSMDPYQRDPQAFYNYVYDMQRKMNMGHYPSAAAAAASQNAQQHNHGNSSSCSSSQYASMKAAMDSFGNVDLFSQLPYQHPQYLQQLMQQQMQLYSAGGAAANNMKELQAFEHFLQQGWNMQQAMQQGSSWLNANQMGKMPVPHQQQHHQQQQQHLKQQQHLQQQQQQQQQQQPSSVMPPSSSPSLASLYHKQQQPQSSSSSSTHHNLSSDLYASKVQSTTTSTTATSSHRHSSKDSPRRPAQSPRGGGTAHLQQGGGPHESSTLPNATPADSLPGHISSKKAAEEKFSISKDLLDTVAAVQKLPVWKPGSERETDQQQLSSPRKTPSSSDACPPPPGSGGSSSREGSSQRRTSSTDRDKTFEDLMRKVESSPHHQRLLKHTPARSETRESQSSENLDQYDDTKGGVDYDDFDFDTNDEDYRPRGRGRPGVKRGSVRGRGRPRGSGAGARGRGRAKVRPIDTKALEKVHKTVAGTDYDFENEFEDDFSERKEPDLSLQALREQTKRQNMILDAKKEEELEEKESFAPSAAFDFDVAFKKKSILNSSKAARPKVKSKGTKGRPKKKRTPSPVTSDFAEEDEKPPPPRLPKLKLGALLIKKETPKSSPKLNRKSSVEKESAVKVPKLKIKFGPKPPSREEKAEDESKKKTDTASTLTEGQKPSKEEERSEATPAVQSTVAAMAVKEETEEAKHVPSEAGKDKLPSSTPVVASVAPTEESSEQPQATKESPQKTSPSSPAKKVSKIDLLANRLMDAKQSKTSNSDVAAIFGPSRPLDMSATSAGNTTLSALSKALPSDQQAEEKSELDLLKEEMKNLTKATAPSGAGTGTSAATATAAPSTLSSGDASVAGGGSRSPPKKSLAAASPRYLDDDSATRSQHLKMKFKRHTTTPAAVASADSAVSSQATPSAETIMQSVHPRMRKKEILSKYFGNDAYAAPPPVNGPVGSGGGSNPLSMTSREHQQQQQQQQQVRSFIKMPKAVASVTSVPTRADYQQQLDANLERKRKLKGLEPTPSDKGSGGKKKKGRGKQADDDGDYRPKTSADVKKEEKKDNGRKTRGKPPKKCLAESPPHDAAETGDFKAESMKYAEQIMASFDKEEERAKTVRRGGGSGSRGRKRKRTTPPPRKGSGGASVGGDKTPTATLGAPSNAKTPRLVIKFSKDSNKNSDKSKSNSPALPAESGAPVARNREDRDKVDKVTHPNFLVDKDSSKKNGLEAFNFVDDDETSAAAASVTPPPPMVDGNAELVSASKLPKIKIKI